MPLEMNLLVQLAFTPLKIPSSELAISHGKPAKQDEVHDWQEVQERGFQDESP